MIEAVFKREGGILSGVTVSGHAGFAEYGSDIVCAAVTSSLQLIANGITEVLRVDMPVTADENRIGFLLPAGSPPAAYSFVQALYFHFAVLASQYEEHLELSVLEI